MKKKSYLKLHIVIALSCLPILSFSITKGTRHDSPVLQRLLKEIPKGFGDFCLDSAYLSRKEDVQQDRHSGQNTFHKAKEEHVQKFKRESGVEEDGIVVH